MHIAASAAPTCVQCASRSDQVPAELIDKERAIFAAQAAERGKPPEIVAKMVEGRINKFLAESDAARPAVRQGPGRARSRSTLKAKGASVRGFAALVVGEGIEKKKDDFAAEVAAMARA